MMKKFNINEYVKVKLNESGITELKRQHEELKARGYKGDFMIPEVDINGYTKYQLHNLMNIFGHLTFNGFECPFEIEILIDI